jgi:hypothetical protein
MRKNLNKFTPRIIGLEMFKKYMHRNKFRPRIIGLKMFQRYIHRWNL